MYGILLKNHRSVVGIFVLDIVVGKIRSLPGPLFHGGHHAKKSIPS
jgi:hypothetical protein